jgi:predicted transcriptional regulator
MTPVVEIMLAAGQAPWWWGWTLLAAALLAAGWMTMGGRMRPRHFKRRTERQQRNAALCQLTVQQYLALSRRERKRQVDEALVVAALREHGPLTGWRLIVETGRSGLRVYAALGRLANAGHVQRQLSTGENARYHYRLAATRADCPPPGNGDAAPNPPAVERG